MHDLLCFCFIKLWGAVQTTPSSPYLCNSYKNLYCEIKVYNIFYLSLHLIFRKSKKYYLYKNTNMKQIYILLIALLMGLSAKAESSGTCGPNLKWHLTHDGVLTITGKGRMDNYYDDDYYGGGPWRYYDIKRVIIGDSVTTIGEYAFSGCRSLTSVTISNSVTTIGYSAFRECNSLTSVTIPNSVTTIGAGAFSHCSSLTSVTIPNSVTTIGDNAFSYCKSLTSVTIPNSVTTIGDGAFSDCSSLISVTIPNSVTTIGGWAFSDCIYNHRTTKTNQKYPSVNL